MPVKAHFTQLFVLQRNGPPEKSGLQSVWRRYVISSQPRVFKQFIHPYQSYCGVGQGIWQKNRPILLVNRNLAQNWCSINVLPSKVTYGKKMVASEFWAISLLSFISSRNLGQNPCPITEGNIEYKTMLMIFEYTRLFLFFSYVVRFSSNFSSKSNRLYSKLQT